MCSFALPTYAADGTEPINVLDMDIVGISYNANDEFGEDVTDELTINIDNSPSVFKGYFRIVFPKPSLENDRILVSLSFDEDFRLTSDHQYNLSFNWGYNRSLASSVCVLLKYYDNNGALLKQEFILNEEGHGSDKIHNVDVDFKPNTSDISVGYKCKLEFLFYQQGYNSTASTQNFYISPEISLIDKDDDSGWFQKILNAITSIPEKISSFFSELKNGITELGNNIKGFFTDLGDKIGGFFIELKDNLIEGLKGLFVPSEGFFEEKKAELELFLEDHFGILWTAPNIIISTIEQLLTMSPEEPSITMPAIQFTWENELITLTEPMTVNFNDYIGDGTPLEAFYNFYRIFVTIVLIFLFINYCLKKYHYIFGKDGEAVEH